MNWPTEITVALVSSGFGLAVLFVTLYFQAKRDHIDADRRYTEIFLQHKLTELTSFLKQMSTMNDDLYRLITSDRMPISQIDEMLREQYALVRQASSLRAAVTPYLTEKIEETLHDYAEVRNEITNHIQELRIRYQGTHTGQLTEYSPQQRKVDVTRLMTAYARVVDELSYLLNPPRFRNFHSDSSRPHRRGIMNV